MISSIKNNKKLKEYCVETIADAGVEVMLDQSLTPDDYVAVKPDDYYNELKMTDTPKMVDFIVAVDCVSSNYVLYVLELKGGAYSNPEVQEKFANAINIFMEKDFCEIYCADCYKFKSIYLYLISNRPLAALKCGSYEEYVRIYNKIKTRDTLSKDLFLSDRIFRFRGKILRINREIPSGLVIKKEL